MHISVCAAWKPHCYFCCCTTALQKKKKGARHLLIERDYNGDSAKAQHNHYTAESTKDETDISWLFQSQLKVAALGWSLLHEQVSNIDALKQGDTQRLQIIFIYRLRLTLHGDKHGINHDRILDLN